MQSHGQEVIKETQGDLFDQILLLKNPKLRLLIACQILIRFGEHLDEDELRHIVVTFGVEAPRVAIQAAEILFVRTTDPEMLGVIAKYCPSFRTRAWEKVERIFPQEESPGRKVFLDLCKKVRLAISEEKYKKKYPEPWNALRLVATPAPPSKT